MKIKLQGRPKRHDITVLDAAAAERIDENFNQLFIDMRAIVTALKAYRVDLSSPDDVVGTPTTFALAPPPPDKGEG